ncbi:MAG: hypothetical protein AAF543_24370 [Pseudomonadota bacterium]
MRTRANEFGAASKKWGEHGCDSDDDADKLNSFIAEARQLYKELDALRKGEKKVHDEACKAVQAKFKPLMSAVESAGNLAKRLMTGWLQKKQAEEKERARREAEAAAEAEKDALEAKAGAEARGDFVAAEEAEEKAGLQAKKAEAASNPDRAVSRSSTGGRSIGLRTIKTAKINNPKLVALHFIAHPDMLSLLERLATAEIRAGREVLGTTIKEEQVAA